MSGDKMTRKQAIDYLDRKQKLNKKNKKFTDNEEQEINQTMKEGKIYGDPLVILK